MDREAIWEVTPSQWETLAEYARLLANTEIAQQDYVDRLRSMGMPPSGPGSHVRIVLRTSRRSTVIPAAALRSGQLPGLPH